MGNTPSIMLFHCRFHNQMARFFNRINVNYVAWMLQNVKESFIFRSSSTYYISRQLQESKVFLFFLFFFIKKEKQEEELVLNYRDRKVAKNWREFFYFSLFNYQGGKKYK